MKPAALLLALLFTCMAFGSDDFRDPFDTAALESSEAPLLLRDPWEKTNRTLFKFNDRLYVYALRPVAKGWKTVTPSLLRQSLSNLFSNVKYPVRLINNALQNERQGMIDETKRFFINSTIGLGGLIDTADKAFHIPAHPTNTDATLAYHGLKPGRYLVLPLLGPSSERGIGGLLGDAALTPWSYVPTSAPIALIYAPWPSELINTLSQRTDDIDTVRTATLDPYAALRSAYSDGLKQHKQKPRWKCCRGR